jgi:hypothetical protein
MSTVAQLSSSAASVAGSATPWGAIIGGASSVLNNVVDNLFSSGQKKKAEEFKRSLAVLDNTQQENLNYAILNAKTDTDRMAILTGAVANINQSQLTNNSSSKNTNLLVALAAVVVLVAAVYFLNK